MLPLHFGILTEAISIALSSLQQIQSISLVLCGLKLFYKKVVLKNFAKFTGVFSATGVSSEFCDILKNTFFAEHLQWLLLAFASIEISYSNTVCNKSAAEEWTCLVSFYGGAKDFVFTCMFCRIIFFFIKI